jgi:hypothetical protein
MSGDTETKLPGGLGLWQGAALGIGGMLFGTIISVNSLLERNTADRAMIAELKTQVLSLDREVRHIGLELARIGESLQRREATNGNGKISRN